MRPKKILGHDPSIETIILHTDTETVQETIGTGHTDLRQETETAGMLINTETALNHRTTDTTGTGLNHLSVTTDTIETDLSHRTVTIDTIVRVANHLLSNETSNLTTLQKIQTETLSVLRVNVAVTSVGTVTTIETIITTKTNITETLLTIGTVTTTQTIYQYGKYKAVHSVPMITMKTTTRL